jgi:D-alanyl-D-alanine carboxypeptidase (penicillin-binding protein 5/6)
MALPSGNDAAVAVALHFAPSEKQFVQRMNQEARRMGLSNTRFMDSSGLNENNMTTALEFAMFCREYLRLHPEALADYHSVREFTYPRVENVAPGRTPKPVVLHNSNSLLFSFPGVDGLKTGFIDESGYNIALTAKRGETRLIAVIMGAPAIRGGDQIRNEDGRELLNWGFEHYKTMRPVPRTPLPMARVWNGLHGYVPVLPVGELTLTTTADRGEHLHWENDLYKPLLAPLPAGSSVGELVLYDDVGELGRIPLITAAEITSTAEGRSRLDTDIFRSLHSSKSP